MTNAAYINYTANFIFTCENTLKRVANAETDSARKAILGRQTVRGIEWAIEFVNGLNTEYMSDRELNHAIRCTNFRGNTRPVFTV